MKKKYWIFSVIILFAFIVGFVVLNKEDDIEKVLIGRRYTYKDVLEALKDIDISKYFLGITKEEVAKAICEI